MKQVSSEDSELLSAWRSGRAESIILFKAVREPMRQRARQGIRMITAADPDEHDVENVVYDAYLELMRKDPATVTSLAGLAMAIAYRRGQDAGRVIIHEREQMRGFVTHFGVTADLSFAEDDVREAAVQEELVQFALECLEQLTAEQRDVVRATIMGSTSLSDWALRSGKSHQSSSRQRFRALDSLRRCVNSKRSPDHEGVNDER